MTHLTEFLNKGKCERIVLVLVTSWLTTTERMAASTTFDGYSRAEMDRVLAQVRTYFSQDPSFCGMAIDDYDHYGALRP